MDVLVCVGLLVKIRNMFNDVTVEWLKFFLWHAILLSDVFMYFTCVCVCNIAHTYFPLFTAAEFSVALAALVLRSMQNITFQHIALCICL